MTHYFHVFSSFYIYDNKVRIWNDQFENKVKREKLPKPKSVYLCAVCAYRYGSRCYDPLGTINSCKSLSSFFLHFCHVYVPTTSDLYYYYYFFGWCVVHWIVQCAIGVCSARSETKPHGVSNTKITQWRQPHTHFFFINEK